MSKAITVQNLRKLNPANPKLDDDLEMTVKETVFFMAPDLVQMTKRGFTNKELSDGLAAEGVSIKPGTLNRYLNDYLVAKGETKRGKADSQSDDFKDESTDAGSETASPKLNRQVGISRSLYSDKQSDSLGGDAEPGGSNHHGRTSGRQVNEAPRNPEPLSENPKPARENPKLDEKVDGEKSDVPPKNQSDFPPQIRSNSHA